MQHFQTVIEHEKPRTIFHLQHGIDMLPLYGPDDAPNISDSFLAQVFRRIIREETMNKVFYDGSITNTFDFINFCKNRDNEVFFVQSNGQEAGFFWLNRFRQKSSFITYCLYREFWGEQAMKISKLGVAFLFSRKDAHGEHLLDVLLGLTPATNTLALKFLLKNGMTVLGKVPGFLHDANAGKAVDGIFSYKQRQNKSAISFPTFLFIH